MSRTNLEWTLILDTALWLAATPAHTQQEAVLQPWKEVCGSVNGVQMGM